MIGLDCNILVQLAFADHPANAKTLAAVHNETQTGARLTIPSLIINEFLHVSTDSRRVDPPLTMIEALDWVEELLNVSLRANSPTNLRVKITHPLR